MGLTQCRLSWRHWPFLLFQADLSSLPEIDNSLAVFCMATYGEGDPTDNAQDFYDWLQETDLDLSGVKYAVSLPQPLWVHCTCMLPYSLDPHASKDTLLLLPP